MLRYRASKKMYGVPLLPPEYEVCSAFAYNLVNFFGGSAGERIIGLSTACRLNG
jgi:hypothetical protein